jgi:hypothetical protein
VLHLLKPLLEYSFCKTIEIQLHTQKQGRRSVAVEEVQRKLLNAQRALSFVQICMHTLAH